MYNGKYYKLLEYLNNITDKDTITLSFNEIQSILGFSLVDSALRKNAWWANDEVSHTQAKAWLEAGWRTKEIKLGNSITFYRSQ